MKTAYLDIETLPAFDLTPESLISLARQKVPKNYKKPEAIDRWLMENSNQVWRDTSFDPMMGKLLCVGYACEDEDPVVFAPPTSLSPWVEEEAVLWQLLARLKKDRPNTICGHYISRFDAPFLLAKAIEFEVWELGRFLFQEKPWSGTLFDTWDKWPSTGRGQAKLDRVAQFTGAPGKGDLDGSKVFDYWSAGRHEEIVHYCAEDVIRTRHVAKTLRRLGVT